MAPSPILEQIAEWPHLRETAGGLIGAIAVLLIARALFARFGRRKKKVSTTSFVSRDELDVRLDEPLRNLPERQKEMAALCAKATPSAIDIVNKLLSIGLSLKASDIHLNPSVEGTRAKLRIHGLLYDLCTIPEFMHPLIVSRIKVVSDLAIFKKNTPQDGRIRLEDDAYTARVSVLPTNHGEKVVMRLASRQGGLYDIDKLGMSADMVTLYKALLNRNQGVIVLTGPTGSGKTTTLYASMLHIDATRGRNVNIVTLEDPIEFDFPRFTQTQIDTASGLTFAVGLRSVLRQDPDVIMLGEIRDDETANNAMRAAMTGHLLFTTVHADSAAGVFTRLGQIGIDPNHLATAVCAVISQRLCQRLCQHCRREAPVTPTHVRQLQLVGVTEPPEGPFYAASGCEHCLEMGFDGLMPIYEMLVVSNKLRDLISSAEPAHRLQQAAVVEGMATLLDDGLAKARRGEVSLDEVLRVVVQ